MDPDATLDVINDADYKPFARYEAIFALLDWIDMGGSFPASDRPDSGLMVEADWGDLADYDGSQLAAYDLAAKLANGLDR